MFWPAVRLVLEKIATLQEIETHYSVDDVLRINDALDLKLDTIRKARETKT